MNVILQNIDKETLKPFKALAQALKVKIKVQNEPLSAFEKGVLRAKKELEQAKKDGTIISFRSQKEFRRAIDNGKL